MYEERIIRNVYDDRINMGFRRIYSSNCVQSVEGILKGFSGRINLCFNIAARSGDSVRDRKMALGGVRQRL